MTSHAANRPWLLRGTDARGGGARVEVAEGAGPVPLEDAVAAQPDVVGCWARLVYGEGLPMLAHRTQPPDPPLVHVGFRRAVARAELACWFAREQALLRQLLGALCIDDGERFAAFAARYHAWAVAQASARWLLDDGADIAATLRPFVTPSASARFPALFTQLATNRAQVVDSFNELDLRREEGNIILTGAGLIHGFVGQPHSATPIDRSTLALQQLFRQLKGLVHAGACDGDLRALIEASPLGETRALNAAPPQNSAWLPVRVDGDFAVVEPQQCGADPHKLASFFTPFAWDGRQVRFAAGDPGYGLRSEEVEARLKEAVLAPTSLDRVRRAPRLLHRSGCERSQLACLVDEPESWPFFTAHRVDLDGAATHPASWRVEQTGSAFQQLLVTSGEVELTRERTATVTLRPSTSAFIPATMVGSYRLSSRGPASVLLFSLPVPRPAA